jgi:hypothetical protein
MPRDFELPAGRKPDAWVPWTDTSNGREQLFSIMARLRPEISVDQAQRWASLASDRIRFTPELKKNSSPKISIVARYMDPKSRTPLMALLGAVSFVFVIACLNVAGMMLSRGCTRRRETAIRAAIGASRARIARLFLIESFILSISGGLAALIISGWTTRLIISMLPRQLYLQQLWFHDYSSLNIRSFIFAATIGVLACLLSGLIPALRGTRDSRIPGLAETARIPGATPAMRRLQMCFQSLQACLAIILLIGSRAHGQQLFENGPYKAGIRYGQSMASKNLSPNKCQGSGSDLDLQSAEDACCVDPRSKVSNGFERDASRLLPYSQWGHDPGGTNRSRIQSPGVLCSSGLFFHPENPINRRTKLYSGRHLIFDAGSYYRRPLRGKILARTKPAWQANPI